MISNNDTNFKLSFHSPNPCPLPLPSPPYPYASIYIQLPHTDTPFFRFYRKAWANRKENSGRLTWVRNSSRKSSATYFYQCVQYFRVSKQWYGCKCLGFLTCVQMLMCAIAHGFCTDTLRESALKVDSGRKGPYRTGNPNPRQYCVWLFSRMLYQLSHHRSLRLQPTLHQGHVTTCTISCYGKPT